MLANRLDQYQILQVPLVIRAPSTSTHTCVRVWEATATIEMVADDPESCTLCIAQEDIGG